MDAERTLEIKGEGMARGQEVKVKEIPMNKIKIGRNSRLSVSKEDLSGLMQSINSTGLLEPIGVVETASGGYEIAYGNRRFMAFSKLGLHSIPAVIHKRKKDLTVDVMNLAENVQRRNISLAEIGRYASILEGEGLGKKELAVRLGTSVNYIESCLMAFKAVPEEFRDDLEPSMAGRKVSPGKITIKAANAIVNAGKSQSLNRTEKALLFKAAKSDDRFDPENVSKYVAAIRGGEKDPIGAIRPIKTMTFRFMMNESEYEKLMEKYVNDGPFNSFTALIKSVLAGKTSAKMNFIG